MSERTTSVTVTIDLTPHRYEELCKEQAALNTDNQALKEKLKGARDHYTNLIDGHDLRLKEIAAIVNSGKEDVSIEAAIDMDYIDGVVNYRHPVTNDILKSRPMEEHERQDQLPIAEQPNEEARP